MPENIKLFRQGGMNTDDSIELIPQNDHVEAYNLRVMGTSEGEEGLATNIESNVLVSGLRPLGLNKAIGAAGFEVTRNAYSFIYNSQSKNLLTKLNYDTNTQKNLFENLTNSAGNNILPLNPEYYVNDIKLINDKFLAWTDGNYQPCLVNAERLEAGGYGTLTANDLLMIKGQPMTPPVVEYRSDATRSSNLLKENLFQFMYQYIYLDNEYSAFSIMSKREVPENEDTPAVGSSVIINNSLLISVNIGTDRVKNLNIVARIGTQDFFAIKNISRSAILALPNTFISFENEVREVYNPLTNIYSFVFYNDGLYVNEDPLVTDVPYDYVPLKCETLENINGNQLALGGITEGYPRPTTDVLVQSVTYNPNVDIAPADPGIVLRVDNSYQFKPDGVSYRKVFINYKGIAKTGDKLKVVTSDLDGFVFETMTYTVPASQDGNTEAAVRSFGATMTLYPNNVSVFDGTVTLQFTTRRENNTPNGKREQMLSASVELSGTGTGASVSRPTLKSNSSYQAFLWYKDTWGRYFPICTDERYVIKTPSYAQVQGLASMLSWQIKHNPPADAAYYGWGLSQNTTHETTLWVQGKLDTALSNANYFVFNINPLLKFNEANPSSVLNYDYSPGDRCTFVYYNTGNNVATKTWLQKVDVEVADFAIEVSDTEPPVTNYLLKVRKPTSVTLATLTDKNVMLELYTPKQRVASVNGQQQYTEQFFYEVGLSYPIVNGQHSVTSGTIKTGDVYIKSRQMVNAVNLNQVDTLVVEDFNFSDFYESKFTSYGKPRTYNDETGRLEQKGVIRYSDVFQRGSLVNGLTKFYPEAIYGDADGETSSNYGWIRKIRQRNNTLVVLQELKVGYVPVFQSIVEDQRGTEQYSISAKIFNYVRYNGKNIGMGNAKESYAEWNNNLYFVDPFRSEPIRAGLDGVDVISGKMTKYFKRVLQQAYESGKKLIGYYDIFNNEYLLSTETTGDILVSVPFNALNWQLADSYTIPAAGISITANGTKGVASYNSTTGIATYTPNTGQTGADSFTFSFTPSGGALTTKKVCLTIQPGNANPNLITFAPIVGADYNTEYDSNPVLISGNDIAAPISISAGGEYQINGGEWTSEPGFADPDSDILVRLNSSALEGVTLATTLTAGSVSAIFSVTTKDDTPDAFTFTAVLGAEINTLYNSNTVTIMGITGAVDISVVDGEYRIDGGAWTSAAGTITNNQTVQLRRTSSSLYETAVQATLTVGTVSSSFSITTKDITPEPFVFTDVTNAEVSTVYESNIVTITGITSSANISIVGGEYRVDGGSWVSANGTIANGQTAQVRRTSSSAYEAAVEATLTVGTYSDTYSIATRAALPVTVNYSMTKDVSPYVDLILVPLINGVNVGNVYATSTGSIAPVLEGNSVTIAIAHSVTGYPWPADSGAYLVVSANGVEVYNSGLITNPSIADLASYTFTAMGGVIYQATAVSNSDSTAYTTSLFNLSNDSSAALTTNSSFPVVDFRFIDNTNGLFVAYTAQYSQPQNNNSFNWLTDANTGKLIINNNSPYDLGFTLSNLAYGGSYNTTITILNGLAGEFNAIPKTSYDISYVDSAGATYYNTEMSESFRKNDCASGSSGTYVTYTVPAGTYSSTVSQIDADNQAEADIAANGQNYANTNATCLLNTSNAIISVDMFDDATLDVCAYIDTVGVSESSGIAARDGLNFYLLTDPAPSAYILASDNISQPTLKRRFIFNIGKLIAQYPDATAIPQFIFKVRGRSATAGIKNGLWQREYADVSMTMTGEPGSYIPTTIPSGGPTASAWNANVLGGGDGTVGIGVGAVIMTFTYNRATDTITLVTE